MTSEKSEAANKCPSSADHFDGHGEALKQFMRHSPMQHVQGYTGSHWTPPSGDYSLRIALAATRAPANKTTMYYVPPFDGHLDGHHDAMVLYRVHCPMEEVQGFHISH